MVTVTEAVPQPFSYTGRELDTESGLYYYRARYYDSNTGRFLSEDPIGFNAGDQSHYRYVLNNQMNLVDPFGLFPPELVPDFVIENTQNVVQSVTGDAFSQGELNVLTELVIEGVDTFSTQGGLGDALEVGNVDPFKFPVELTQDQFESLIEIIDNVTELDLTPDQKTLVDKAIQEFESALDTGDVKVEGTCNF